MALGEIGRRGKQPPRTLGDAYLKLMVLPGEPEMMLICTTDAEGKELERIRLSERNCWELIGFLSLFIGLSLPKSLGKRIRLTMGRGKEQNP